MTIFLLHADFSELVIAREDTAFSSFVKLSLIKGFE